MFAVVFGVSSFLDRGAVAYPDRAAIVFEGREISYRQLRDQSNKIANRLMETELAAGARVATYMPNDPASFACQFGIDRTPFVWLPLNPKSSSHEVASIMANFQAEWLFIHSDFAGHLDLIRAEVGSLRGIVCVDAQIRDLMALDVWLADASDEEPFTRIEPLDTAVLRTTGGSTGKPKGVQRTNLCQILQTADYLSALPYDAPPRNLILAPLSHAGGSAAMPIFASFGTQYILNSTAPKDILAFIEAHAITTVFMPPTLIYNLLACETIRHYDLSSLKYLIYGTAPMSVQKFREAWEVFGPVLAQIYGMTEASSSISIMTPAEYSDALNNNGERLASCGRGSVNYRLRVTDKSGKEVEPRTVGEVTCASHEVMTGYADDASGTNAAIRDGWLLTGDLGYMDEDGYVYIVDRLKDIIISGGFNVYPGEVEQVVFTHPAVKDCAVVGVPDEKWGEVVTAVVELKHGSVETSADILSFCRERLGGVKSPKALHIWEALPKSPLGKVLRKQVRDHFWSDVSRRI
jgi:acyl-CoA synthetase (AMP-forming)/AMP-acid ligase II